MASGNTNTKKLMTKAKLVILRERLGRDRSMGPSAYNGMVNTGTKAELEVEARRAKARLAQVERALSEGKPVPKPPVPKTDHYMVARVDDVTSRATKPARLGAGVWVDDETWRRRQLAKGRAQR